MSHIKVLGTGCANCKTTLKLIEDAARAKGVDVQLEKVEDIAEIMKYGVMSTPALVIDGQVKFSGKVASAGEIREMLS